MKRSPLRRKTPMKRSGFKNLSQLKRTKIKPVSKKRQKENKEYTKLRKEFLMEHPRCEVAGCREQATQVHHRARRGRYFLRVDTFLAVCLLHHEEIERNGEWAKAQGYTLTPEARRLLD